MDQNKWSTFGVWFRTNIRRCWDFPEAPRLRTARNGNIVKLKVEPCEIGTGTSKSSGSLRAKYQGCLDDFFTELSDRNNYVFGTNYNAGPRIQSKSDRNSNGLGGGIKTILCDLLNAER